LRAIKGPELEQALLILPFAHVCRLISYLVNLLKTNLDVELCVRVSAFLLSIHQTQIVATNSLLEELDELRGLVRQRIDDYRNCIGLNRAGLTLLKRSMEENKTAYLRITDDTAAASAPAKNAKRRRKGAKWEA
jgi:U3 small nucleolar RNA-associated protein 12